MSRYIHIFIHILILCSKANFWFYTTLEWINWNNKTIYQYFPTICVYLFTKAIFDYMLSWDNNSHYNLVTIIRYYFRFFYLLIVYLCSRIPDKSWIYVVLKDNNELKLSNHPSIESSIWCDLYYVILNSTSMN